MNRKMTLHIIGSPWYRGTPYSDQPQGIYIAARRSRSRTRSEDRVPSPTYSTEDGAEKPGLKWSDGDLVFQISESPITHFAGAKNNYRWWFNGDIAPKKDRNHIPRSLNNPFVWSQMCVNPVLNHGFFGMSNISGMDWCSNLLVCFGGSNINQSWFGCNC